MLGEQGHCSPDGHHHANNHEESHPARPILGRFDPHRRLSATVFPPGEPIADKEGKPQSNDQFGEQVLDIEEVAHFSPR